MKINYCRNCGWGNALDDRYCARCGVPTPLEYGHRLTTVATTSIAALDFNKAFVVADNGLAGATEWTTDYNIATVEIADPCEIASAWPKSTQLEVYKHLYNLGCRLEGIDHEIAKAKRVEKDAKAT